MLTPSRVHAGSVLGGVVVAIATLTQGPSAQTVAGPQVTFTKDVAPILQRSCQSCHRPDEMAPMSLLTYEDARPWARAIKLRVTTREMPPWHIDRTVGIQHFKNDPSLTEQDIATIAAWVDAGAPRGNPAHLPPPARFQDPREWSIGKPDVIVSMPRDHVIPAKGPDWWGDYVSDPIPITEPRYLKARETRPSPDGRPGVHHASLSIVYDSDSGRMDEGTTLGGFNPGRPGEIYPDDTGVLVKPGARVKFSMHYYAFGKEAKDRTSIGLVFYPKGTEPKYVLETGRLENSNDDLDIPAGADNVRFDSYHKVEKPTLLAAYQPHMHNRGKRQCLEAIYPDMRAEMLSCINFNFAWQLRYEYADHVAPLLPAGTILHVISWFDNSPRNPFNQDPRNWVGYGQRTIDEMARNRLEYYELSDDDFKARVDARKRLNTTQ